MEVSHLIGAAVVAAWILFTAGALFGFWLSGRLRGGTVEDLYRELYRRDCLIADLRTRLRHLQPEANPLAYLGILN